VEVLVRIGRWRLFIRHFLLLFRDGSLEGASVRRGGRALSCCWMLGGADHAAGAWLVVASAWLDPPFNAVWAGVCLFIPGDCFVACAACQSLTSAALFPCVPESPSISCRCGRVDEATALMNRVAAGNGIQEKAHTETPAGLQPGVHAQFGVAPARSRMRALRSDAASALLDLFSRRPAASAAAHLEFNSAVHCVTMALPAVVSELFKRVEAYGGSALQSAAPGTVTRRPVRLLTTAHSNACDTP
uniref:Abhydrolase_3 domain-containing protein n=1 Tax=Macrostomum lignano TaxID=282301 RepID=A0A1I8FEL3_9PLAT